MTRPLFRMLLASIALTAVMTAAHAKEADPDSKHDNGDEQDSPRILKDQSQMTSGSLTVKGAKLLYQAEAGVQVVYLKDPKDDDPQPRHDGCFPAHYLSI